MTFKTDEHSLIRLIELEFQRNIKQKKVALKYDVLQQGRCHCSTKAEMDREGPDVTMSVERRRRGKCKSSMPTLMPQVTECSQQTVQLNQR